MSEEKALTTGNGNGTPAKDPVVDEAKQVFQRIYTSVLQGLCTQEKMTTNEDQLIDTAKRITQKAFAALFGPQAPVAQSAPMPHPGMPHPAMAMMMATPGGMPGFAPPAAYGGMPNMPNNPPGVIVGPAPSQCLICGQPIKGPSTNPVCKDNHLPPIQ